MKDNPTSKILPLAAAYKKRDRLMAYNRLVVLSCDQRVMAAAL